MAGKPSTQKFIEVKNIEDDIVYLNDGGLRQVVIVSGINLDLKSEEERNVVLGLYQKFLNSLDFPIQILVHSRKFNIENYIKNMDALEKTETNELLKNQIFEYKQFIKTFVEQNDIMTKMFLVVVPFNPINLVSDNGFFSKFFKSKKKKVAEVDAAQNTNKDVNTRQLKQRTEQVIDGIQSIGLRAVTLNNEELTEIFYNFYNPETVEKESLNLPNQNQNGQQ